MPQEKAEVHAVAAVLENTGKHIIVAPDTGKAAKTIYRPLKAVSGKDDIGVRPLSYAVDACVDIIAPLMEDRRNSRP